MILIVIGGPNGDKTGAGKRIAVVDDREIIRKMLSDLLPKLFPGVEIKVFSGGLELISELYEGQIYDLIIMDGMLTDGLTGPLYTEEFVNFVPE